MRIKNWEEFQHYKDRDPKWIKLYKKLLDDHEWHKLDPQSSKILVMLWLLASEENGNLPSIAEMAFRLRLSEKLIESTVTKLSHWLEQGASKPLAECSASAIPELEKELEEYKEEKETETTALAVVDDFEVFWRAYPKKKSKDAARRAWEKAKRKPPLDNMLEVIALAKQSEDWKREGGKYIPYPATWLNAGGWADEIKVEVGMSDPNGMMAQYSAFVARHS